MSRRIREAHDTNHSAMAPGHRSNRARTSGRTTCADVERDAWARVDADRQALLEVDVLGADVDPQESGTVAPNLKSEPFDREVFESMVRGAEATLDVRVVSNW